VSPKYSLQHIAGLAYHWGYCQAIEYDQTRADIFPQGYLTQLYNICKSSGRAKLGILEPLFCSMLDLSHDAITSYLHTRKLVVLGEWRPDPCQADPPFFTPLGFCFLSTTARGKTTASGFGAYGFSSEAWRTPQQHVLTYLGISYLFQENGLNSLHGIRYADNKLTARWMQKFGFVDVGTIPDYMPRPSTGELTAATVSTLSREKFEEIFSAALELGETLEE
jgi:hypothetical protein